MTQESPSASLRAAGAAIFHQVRDYLLGEGRTAIQAAGRNPKGDTQLAMDRRADEIAVEALRQLFGSFQLYSEEQGVVQVGEHPDQAIVIDPVDGSTNFARGVRATGFAFAVMDGTALDLSRLRFAVFGDVFHGDVYTAIRGEGAERNGEPIQGSQRRTLRGGILCLNASLLQHYDIHRNGVLRGVSGLRWTGAAVLDTGYVADGGYDAFLELRGGLTPENFAATALVIQEAGGVITNREGEPFGEMTMTRGSTVVAAGNPTLHASIIHRLRQDVRTPWDRRRASDTMVAAMADQLRLETE